MSRWLAEFLRGRGYTVAEQPLANGRFNVLGTLDAPPQVVFSTHVDCVPPFFPSREERGLIFGRGAFFGCAVRPSGDTYWFSNYVQKAEPQDRRRLSVSADSGGALSGLINEGCSCAPC